MIRNFSLRQKLHLLFALLWGELNKRIRYDGKTTATANSTETAFNLQLPIKPPSHVRTIAGT